MSQFYKGYYPPIDGGCLCDEEFGHFLYGLEPQYTGIPYRVLHFGTGIHHRVGKVARSNCNVIGVTGSRTEYSAYQDLCESEEFHPNYWAIYADQYQLTQKALGEFDYISLFHLCEYSNHNPQLDKRLLNFAVKSLMPGGKIILWSGSNHYSQAKYLVDLNQDLTYAYKYRSLVIYGATRD